MANRNPDMEQWRVGQKISASFTVTHVQPHSQYCQYKVSRQGWPESIIAKVHHPHLLKHQKASFDEKINSWIRLGIHPHLETCYAPVVGEENAFFYEHIQGKNLRRWISDGSWSLRGALSHAIQLCHGVEYLHRRKMYLPALSAESVCVTNQSLLKITDIILADTLIHQPEIKKECKENDIYGVGLMLWELLCHSSSADTTDYTFLEPDFLHGARNVAHYLRPIIKGCLSIEPDKQFKSVTAIRNAINSAYEQIFGLSCPYYHLEAPDFKGHHANNQAVFLFEEGRIKEGVKKLHQALHLEDRLAEANYNLIVYKLRSGQYHPQKISLMIQAALIDSSLDHQLKKLSIVVQKIQKKDNVKNLLPPPFFLCRSPQALSFYRLQNSQAKKMKSIETYMDKLLYEASHHTLLTTWRKIFFQKNALLAKMYDQLLAKSDKKDIVAVQRVATFQDSEIPLSHLSYVAGTRKIAESRGDDTILIRNFSKKGKVLSLNTKGEQVTALGVSPDGKTISAATEKGSVFLWNSRSLSKIAQSPSHRARVNSIHFSHDGRFLVSGGADGSMVIRTVSTGRDKFVPVWDNRQIRSIAFFPESFDLVTGNDQGEVQIWSSRGRSCMHKISAHNGPVAHLAIAPSGDFFVTSDTKNIKIWDRQTGKCLEEINGHTGGTTALLFLSNQQLITGGNDDMVKIWDLVTSNMAMLLDCRSKGICSLANGAKPHIFFVGCQGGEMIIWKTICNLSFI